MSFPDLGSDLINLIQLSQSSNGASEEFREAAIAEAAARVQGVRFQKASEGHTRWQRWRLGLQTAGDLTAFAGLLMLVVGLTVVCALTIPTWASSADRLFQPWRFVPQVGAIEILDNSNLAMTREFNNMVDKIAALTDDRPSLNHTTEKKTA